MNPCLFTDNDLVGKSPIDIKLEEPEVTPVTSHGSGDPLIRAISATWDLGGTVIFSLAPI